MMSFAAFAADGAGLTTGTFYSVGGGFVVENPGGGTEKRIVPDATVLPFPFRTGDDLLALCEREKASIADDHASQRTHLAQRCANR